MFDISLPVANILFGIANVTLIVGTVLVLMGTIGAIWTGSVKERYADERISGNEATTASARADAARANENTEILRQSNLALQADVERERAARVKLEGKIAPRHLSEGQKSALLSTLAKFKGQRVDLSCILGDSEGKAFAVELDTIFRTAGWDDGGASGVAQAVYNAPEPVGLEITLNAAEVQANRIPQSAVALLDTLVAVGLLQDRRLFSNPQAPSDRIQVRVGRKPE